MAVHALKRRVRALQRSGRAPLLTAAAAYLWHQSKNLRDLRFMGRVRRRMAQVPRAADMEDAVALALEGFGGAIRPLQDRAEVAELARRVAARRPRTVLEIGTARGGTLFLLCEAAHPEAVVISLDLPYGRNGGGYPAWKERTYATFARPGQRLVLLRGDSHDPASLRRVEAALGGRALDFLMIDGDHSYEGVRRDFESYAPLVAADGTIAMHDILENPSDPTIDVHRFWREVSARFRSEEIVADPGQGKFGIGLVWPGAPVATPAPSAEPGVNLTGN